MYRQIECVIILTAIALSGASPLHGQALSISCSGDVDSLCNARVAPADSLQHAIVIVHVTRNAVAVPSAIVRFHASSGTVQPDSTVTDDNGDARAQWFRSKGGEVAAITADAHVGNTSGLAYIRLSPRGEKNETKNIVLRKAGGFKQSWFEKSQLPSPVKVELMSPVIGGSVPLDSIICRQISVEFKLRGGPSKVSPDTAVARTQDGGCYASTFWTLGEGIGERRLDVRVVPTNGYRGVNDTLEAQAWTRANPNFVAGVAVGRFRPYLGLNPASKRTVHIERVDANGAKISYDSTETSGTPAIDSIRARNESFGVIGVSLPIPMGRWDRWDDLSLTAGVDFAHPQDRVFVGISLLRLVGAWIPVIEVLPMDIHFVKLWANQDELVDPRCAPSACKTHKRMRPQGWSAAVTADAGSLFTELLKKLTQ